MFKFSNPFSRTPNPPVNPPTDPDKMSRAQKEATARQAFNEQTAKEILVLIDKEEKPDGATRRKAISLERKQEITREHFTRRREQFDKDLKETLDGPVRKALEGTMDWWDGLDDSRGGKALKVALSTTVVVGGTIAIGDVAGISPGPLGAARKLLTRVGMSVAANMAMTSNIPGKIRELFKGKDDGHTDHDADEGFMKKHYKKILVGGTIVTVYIMSGPIMAAVSGIGIALKEITKRAYDYYIEKQKELSEKKLELVKNGFTIEEAAFEVNKRTRKAIDINVLVGQLDAMNKEYDAFVKAASTAKTLERLKEVTNMAETMAAGIASMEIHDSALDKTTTGDLLHGRIEHRELGGVKSSDIKAEGELVEKNKSATIHNEIRQPGDIRPVTEGELGKVGENMKITQPEVSTPDHPIYTPGHSPEEELAKAKEAVDSAKKELDGATAGEDKSLVDQAKETLKKAEEGLKSAQKTVDELAEQAKHATEKAVDKATAILSQDDIKGMTHADNTVDVSSRGAVATLNELKEKIKLEYKDLDKAPQELQDFVKGNSIAQAKELGLYKPDEVAESANILKGSTLSINEKGQLILHDAKDGEFKIIDEDHKYGGKFGDYMHERSSGGGNGSGYQSPEFVGSTQSGGYTGPEFTGGVPGATGSYDSWSSVTTSTEWSTASSYKAGDFVFSGVFSEASDLTPEEQKICDYLYSQYELALEKDPDIKNLPSIFPSMTVSEFKEVLEKVNAGQMDVPNFKDYIEHYIKGDYVGTFMNDLGDKYRELLNNGDGKNMPSLDELKKMSMSQVNDGMNNVEIGKSFDTEPGEQRAIEGDEEPEKVEVDAARVPLSQNPYELSEEQFKSANALYVDFIKRLPDKTEHLWNESLKDSKATILIHGQDVANNTPELAGPVAAVKFLYTVTKLEPAQQTDLIHPAETTEHYVQRAIHYAFKNGLKLEGLKSIGFKESNK